MAVSFFFWFVAAVLFSAGVAGLFLPALPGIVLVYAGLVAAAWAEGFSYVGPGSIIAMGMLAVFGYGIDLLAGALGARRFGAGRYAVIGAGAGGVVGMFFGLPGLVLGPFIGAVCGELLARKDPVSAGRAGFGAWIGIIVGTAAKIAVVFAMIGVFIAARFF